MSKVCRSQIVLVVDEDVDERLAHHQPHWQQNAEHCHAEGRAPGAGGGLRCSTGAVAAGLAAATTPAAAVAGRSRRRRIGPGHPATTQRPASRPNNGPATITVGIATATPSAKRDAEVRAEQIDRGERSGVRRHQAVHRGKACQRGDSDGDQRQLRPLGDQIDDRHQQHQADLEEHRQADDRTRPAPSPTAAPAATRDRRWCRRFRRRRRSRRAVWRTSHPARSIRPLRRRSSRIRRRTTRAHRRWS